MKVSCFSCSLEMVLTSRDDVDWAKVWLDEILREDEFFVSPRSVTLGQSSSLSQPPATGLAYSIVQQTPKSESWKSQSSHGER